MDLKNKRVLVVGLGKSGVASALFLAGAGRARHRLGRRSRKTNSARKFRCCSITALRSRPAGMANALSGDRI